MSWKLNLAVEKVIALLNASIGIFIFKCQAVHGPLITGIIMTS